MKKIILVFLLLCSIPGFAVEPAVRVSSLSNSLGKNILTMSGYNLECKDDWYNYIINNPTGTNAYTNIFSIQDARSNVVLRFDETKRKYYSQPWTITVTYDLVTYNTGGTATSYTGSESLTIDYHPTDNFKDIDIKSYANSLYSKLKVTGVTLTVNGSPVTWNATENANYPDVYLDIEQRTQLCYIPKPTDPLKLKYADGFNSATPANNELALAWNNLGWAESYDLEWVFVDIPSGTITPSSIVPDFRNATRINTPFNFYNVSLAYPRGIFFMRVRGVGADQSDCETRYEGYWDTDTEMFDEPQGDIVYSFIWNGLDPTYNWQYSASYAEDGKRKEVISYFDGSLRNRQTVTVVNTDSNAVIAETKYDYEGRGVVQMMPTPLQYSGIKYYSNFNTAYDRTKFDLDTKVDLPDAMSTGTGSTTNDYYSVNNSQDGLFNEYIPDAGNFPYSRTQFMADGTDRIKKQSGVGATFKMGSGKETRYLYSNPSSQDELDRLFGNEVGQVTHYQKNCIVDANGQASVQYLDQEGRVIATALAGPPPSNLLAIDNKPAAETVTVDLLEGKNIFDENGNLVNVSTIPVVTPGATHIFSYTLGQHCTAIYCEDDVTVMNSCVDCKYDLEISVTDEDGQALSMTSFTVTTTACTSGTTNPFVCENISNGTYAFTVAFGNVGVYRIVKTLKVSKQNIENMKANYLVDQQALAPANRCVHFPAIVPEPCTYDCESMCLEAFIKRDNNGNIIKDGSNNIILYNDAGEPATGSELTAIQNEITNCQNGCGTQPDAILTECELKLLMLQNDMDPTRSGQYFLNIGAEYDNAGNLNANYATSDWKNWLMQYVKKDDQAAAYYSPYASFEVWFKTIIVGNASDPRDLRDWEYVRDNWDAAWLTNLVTYHPEYCRYKYFCAATLCDDNSVSISSSNSFDETLKNRLGETDLNNISAGYFLPHVTAAWTGATSSASSYTVSNNNYKGSYSYASSADPLLSSSCAISFTACATGSAKDLFQKYLTEFITYTDLQTSQTIKYSIWYVLDDPNGIHSTPACTTNIPGPVIDLFKQLHGDPNDVNTPGIFNTGVTKYAWFHSVYQFFKQHLIYKYYPVWASTHSFSPGAPNCSSSWLDNDGNNDGHYTVSFPASETGEFQVRYPENNVYEMLNVCDVGSVNWAAACSTFTATNDPEGDVCETSCESYADSWIAKLELCSLSTAVKADIRHYMIELCAANCSSTNQEGTDGTGCSSGCPTVTTCTSCPTCSTCTSVVSFTTFDDIINYFTGGACDLLPQHPATDDEQTGDCICNQLSQIIDDNDFAVTNYTDISGFLTSAYGTTVSATDVEAWLKLCGKVATTGTVSLPPDKDAFTNLPAELNCSAPATTTYNAGSCSCENIHYFFSTLGLDESNTTHHTAVANHLNDWLGLSGAGAYTATDVDSWLDECALTTPSVTVLQTLDFPSQFTCPIPEGSSDEEIEEALDASLCFQQNLKEAMEASASQYLEELGDARELYIADYIAGCKSVISASFTNPLATVYETFTMQYQRDEYWYTLYYYDQAGNLIKTVAPEGVDFLTNVSPDFDLDKVEAYRMDPTSPNTFKVPGHTYVSQYKFNSLQNTIEQSTPDGGTTKFYYDDLGRIVLSQNARQANVGNSYSYTQYDDLGRPYEAGELTSPAAASQTIASDKAALSSWMAACTTRTQVVSTYYDEAIPGSISTAYIITGQHNLRNRVSSTTYEEIHDFFPLTFDNASHYSYDIHGNVNTLVQQNNALSSISHSKKRIDYEYDLISGNVNKVSYQDGAADRFYHKYYYDADNRLTIALSSHDNMIWEKESKSFYYPHGPVARNEIGDKQVMGSDYAYTINGWIKGVNSNTLDRDRDIGIDGNTNGLNDHFAVDAFGYTLGYFIGDYTAVGSGARQFEATNPATTGYGFGNSIKNLYNGNISHMVSTQLKTDETDLDILGNVYQYDQLNRIKQADRYTDQTSLKTSNTWSTSATTNSNKYREQFVFDFNGNIIEADRNGHNSGSTMPMDAFHYNYKLNASNQPSNLLEYVSDNAAYDSYYADDIDDQGAGNYDYDLIGNLTKDVSEEIQTINWKVNGKIASIVRTSTSTKSDLEFFYDAMGNRICKLEKPRDGTGLKASSFYKYTYYVRDAQGNVLSVYERRKGPLDIVILMLAEQSIYGSTLVGQYKPGYIDIENASAPPSGGNISYSRTRGFKQYSGSNHLGNVLVTVSDRKLAKDVYSYYSSTPGGYNFRPLENHYKSAFGQYARTNGTDGLVDYYTPDVITSSDYYAFGAPIPDRNFSAPNYRYGYNGKEKDNEVTVDGGDYDFGDRIYDSRLGRWLSVDPYVSKFPSLSPYSYAYDSPIGYADHEGKYPIFKWCGSSVTHVGGKTIIKVSFEVQIKVAVINKSSVILTRGEGNSIASDLELHSAYGNYTGSMPFGEEGNAWIANQGFDQNIASNKDVEIQYSFHVTQSFRYVESADEVGSDEAMLVMLDNHGGVEVGGRAYWESNVATVDIEGITASSGVIKSLGRPLRSGNGGNHEVFHLIGGHDQYKRNNLGNVTERKKGTLMGGYPNEFKLNTYDIESIATNVITSYTLYRQFNKQKNFKAQEYTLKPIDGGTFVPNIIGTPQNLIDKAILDSRNK